MNISFDGTPDIQDYQRPLSDGGPSHELLENTIEQLNKYKVDYGVRSTITERNVKRLVEIVKYFKELGIRNIQLEPVFECGRCLKTKTSSPDSMIFVKNYIKSFETAEKYGIDLHYSGGTIQRISDSFCGAAGRNFFVTTDGYVTSCLEVMHKDDSAAKIFFYGKYDRETKKFKIIKKRQKKLESRTVDKIEACQKCFCKWHCAGDCLIKGWRLHNSLFETDNKRCIINTEIIRYILLRYIKGKPIMMKDFDFARELEIK